MKESPIKVKSYAFAVRIVRLFQWLCSKKNEYILSDCEELLRLLSSSIKTLREKSGMVCETLAEDSSYSDAPPTTFSPTLPS